MAIKNADGSIYQTSDLQQFDPNNVEHDLFNLWDQEAIEMGGTPIQYFDVFINASSIDELYVEARDKIYSNHPVCMYCYYEPIPSSNVVGAFGIDSPDTIMFEFNYRYVLKTLGKTPKIGARIFTPHRGENWMVAQKGVEVFKLWGELRLQVFCVRFPESLTTANGKVTEPRKSDYKVNSVKDLGGNMNLAGGQVQIP